jgi:hypothetical protein
MEQVPHPFALFAQGEASDLNLTRNLTQAGHPCPAFGLWETMNPNRTCCVIQKRALYQGTTRYRGILRVGCRAAELQGGIGL